MATRYSPRIITDGLVGYWDAANKKSYVGTGTSWNDISGNSIVGTMTGVAFGNNIMTFNSTDSVNLTTTSTLNPVSMSISAWVKYTSLAAYGVIASRWNATASNACYFLSNFSGAGKIDWYVYTTASNNLRSTSVELVIDTWYYITATYDSATNTMKIYKNAEEVPSDVPPNIPSGDINTFANTSSIGRDIVRNNHQFNGDMGLVKIHDRALTSDEITNNYEATKGRFI